MISKFPNKPEQGFTLIELVVASALFAVVVTSIIGVYLSASHLDTRSRSLRTLVQNGRFVMEFLEKEITNGHVDYSQANDASNLYIINQSGETEHFFLSNTDLVLDKAPLALTNINSSTVGIESMKFVLEPTIDPLTPAKNSNEQPHVTVFVHLKARTGRDAVSLNLQDTFSELYYPSRQ